MRGLVLAALIAVAQTASPVPPKTLDSPATGQTVAKNPKKDKPPSTQTPTSVGPSAADQQRAGITTKSEDTQQSIRIRELPRVSITKDWSDWGFWAFNGLLVIVGAFQLLVLWRQAKIMKAQAEIMTEHAAHLKGLVIAAEDNAKAASAAAEAASKNADFSKLNAEATSQNAIAAKASADAAKVSADALINSERARLVAEFVPKGARYGNEWHRIESYGPVALSMEEVLAGKHLSYQLKVTNIGRTPAEVFSYKINWGALLEGTPFSPEGLSSSQYQSINEFFGEGESRALHLFNVKDLFERLLGEKEKGAICATIEYGDTVSAPERREHITFVLYYCPDAMSQLQRINTQTKYT
jgi:hypothetical protein